MSILTDLLPLRDTTAAHAAAWLGVDIATRETAGDYGRLANVDVLEAAGRPGIRILLQGDSVAVIYVGRKALPNGVTGEQIRTELGVTDTHSLRSRQGKRGRMTVAAEQGVAWSSLDGVIGWVELFRPRTFEQYEREIYETPPKFIQ